jgi:hypothetical protein
MAIDEYMCLGCGRREDFFDDEVTENDGQVRSEEPCQCGENSWEKVDSVAHTVLGRQTYSYKYVRPDSLKDRNQSIYHVGKAISDRFYEQEYEKSITKGNEE